MGAEIEFNDHTDWDELAKQYHYSELWGKVPVQYREKFYFACLQRVINDTNPYGINLGEGWGR